MPSHEMIADSALPGLAAMLDAGRVADRLQSAHRDRNWDVETCAIEYLRYKPLTNCIVLYRLIVRNRATGTCEEQLLYGKCCTPGDYTLASAKTGRQRWVTGGTFHAWVADPDIPALFYTFPNDPELPGLAMVSEPRKLQRLLYEHPGPYGGGEWRLSDTRLSLRTVRYKPERRAVLQLRTRAVHKSTHAREEYEAYLRSYADPRGAQVQGLMEQLRALGSSGAGPRVPEPYGYDSELRLLLLEALPGRPFTEHLLPALHTTSVEAAGAVLARLHRAPVTGVEHRSKDSLFEDVRASARAIGRVLPEAGSDLDRVLGELERRASRLGATHVGLVHGDFHHGQILLHEGEAALLDFDRAHMGDPVADLGNFCAHAFVLEGQGRVGEALALSRALLTGYAAEGPSPESDRLDFWTVAGLVQLAVHPFRTFQPGWREATRSLIDRCSSLLQ